MSVGIGVFNEQRSFRFFDPDTQAGSITLGRVIPVYDDTNGTWSNRTIYGLSDISSVTIGGDICMVGKNKPWPGDVSPQICRGVPEPPPWTLLVVGVGAMVALKRRSAAV